MGLSNPLALLWAGLAIPIVIFYILKIRMRRVPVSTVMFWNQIFDEKQPRSIWQRLRHLLSLLVQLAFVAMLAFALANPFFDWEIREARRLVLVVDNSASMRATDVEPTRLAVAKEHSADLVDSLRPRDEMAIVAAGTLPKVVCGLTGHQRTLQNALDAIPETDGPTRVAEACELARRLLADHENAQVVVLSDGCFENAAELLAGDDLHWRPVGTDAGNIGITKFQVRRSLVDPLGYQVLAEVTNFSNEDAEFRLDIQLDAQIVDVTPIRLEPGGTWSQVYQKMSPVGGRLLASIDHDDALPHDNAARAILPHRERQRIVLVSQGNLFLERVFQAHPLVDLSVVAELESRPDDVELVVFHHKVPEQIPPGNVLVIDPAGSTDVWETAEELENPVVTNQDKDSRLMTHVRLDNVLMPEARRLKIHSEATVLAESIEGDPLYFSVDRPEGKLLVLTVNLDRGDLPLRTAFPIMMSNALGWFAGTKGELRESLSTGTVAEIELPDSLAGPASSEEGSMPSLVLQSPDGTQRPLAVIDRRTTIGPLDRQGVWRIVSTGDKDADESDDASAASSSTAAVQIACNLANAAESDIRLADDDVPRSTTLQAGWGGRPIWFYLVLLAFGLIAAEWYLYQRRWIS